MSQWRRWRGWGGKGVGVGRMLIHYRNRRIVIDGTAFRNVLLRPHAVVWDATATVGSRSRGSRSLPSLFLRD